MVSELAGKPAPKELLIDVDQLNKAYYEKYPDMTDSSVQVCFGTSGHRGTPQNGSFTEAHVRAITQAILDYRAHVGAAEVLYVGMDTHAISAAAQKTVLEVLAGNGIQTLYQQDGDFTPTPVISHAILSENRRHGANYSDGIIITPSHNPPSDGGIKYNSPMGGPSETDITQWMEKRANEYLENGNRDVRFIPYAEAIKMPNLRPVDLKQAYIDDLVNIIDFEVIRQAKIRLGVDPLGGASVHYWKPIAEKYGLNLTVVNDRVDPTFSFMTVDHDGKIRMDCSSPWSMKRLLTLKDQFDLAFANDPDSDRHGIVVPSVGLMNPNHFLAVAIDYLIKNRPQWPLSPGIGKTLVSSSMIDRVVRTLGRRLVEVPVGFKWFVPGLFNGTLAFGGEESAGASFLKKDGTVWTTDKDGIILDLLAAEILAKTGIDPGVYYQRLEAEFGSPVYRRVDQPATVEQKDAFKNLTPDKVKAEVLAGEPILARLTQAPGNNALIGGLKIVTENGWFAARPSGTENIYKIYAESFLGEEHLDRILKEASELVTETLKS